MSWQLASFGLLAVALAGGFAWYERSRPSSRTVALVAALAALATLGRIAFAPLPNVKPTTDILDGTGVQGPPAGVPATDTLDQGQYLQVTQGTELTGSAVQAACSGGLP